MREKVKVLFVVSEFYQAGTQRFTYEVDRAINRDQFEVNILCLLPLSHNPAWEDHYFTKHAELGTQIFFLEDIARPFVPSIGQRIQRKLLGKPFPHEQQSLHQFLDSYDVISFWGEYNYPVLSRKMTPQQKAKSLIHIMNSRHQTNTLYKDFDKNEVPHFVSGFKDDEVAYELAEFKNYRHSFLALSLHIDDSGIQWSYRHTDKPRIGVFTRITSHKPLDPFIYAFHELLNEVPHAELHIFGTGDPQKEGVTKYIRHLELGDRVKFRGHQEDIKKTAINEKLSLVWFHGYYGVPGGFAGFDICSIGVPQLFWNFGNTTDGSIEGFPMYSNINAFAKRTLEIINDGEEAQKLSHIQYQYICEVRNVRKCITAIESLYLTFKS
ncbi:MAG: hypothetical protein JWO03_3187 [Bacteroidetes bacterium]|nr:hypothetical protein [Bacteroidota bacterium]